MNECACSPILCGSNLGMRPCYAMKVDWKQEATSPRCYIDRYHTTIFMKKIFESVQYVQYVPVQLDRVWEFLPYIIIIYLTYTVCTVAHTKHTPKPQRAACVHPSAVPGSAVLTPKVSSPHSGELQYTVASTTVPGREPSPNATFFGTGMFS